MFSEFAWAISHVFPKHTWGFPSMFREDAWKFSIVFREHAYTSPSVSMEHVDNTVVKVCSGNTLEWFPIVFNKTFVNYEAMCQMIIKILILNVNIARQKLKFKNRQHTLKILN